MTKRWYGVAAIAALAGVHLAAAGPQNMVHGQPAYDSGWVDVDSSGSEVLTHDLGVDSPGLIVDMQLDSDTFGVHQQSIGGDRYFYGAEIALGSWWQGLTSTELTISRAANDADTENLHISLWQTGPPPPLFTDGFEGGDPGRWSGALD